jgi:hypothetical protein
MAPVDCRCQVPLQSGDPRRLGFCSRCGRRINPEWTSNDATFADFFDGLEKSMFPGLTPDWFTRFRNQCQRRERAGRPLYGNRFLGKNNPEDAMEEACDGALYAMLDTLRHLRDHGDDDDFDAALRAAARFAQAYRELLNLKGKRSGRP